MLFCAMSGNRKKDTEGAVRIPNEREDNEKNRWIVKEINMRLSSLAGTIELNCAAAVWLRNFEKE